MSNLVIVGRYPFPGRRLEGMVQRIANIDGRLQDIPRTYLDLYGFKHLKSSRENIDNVEVYTASFLHLFDIFRILRSARTVYVHSIYFYALVLFPLLLVGKKTKVILDVHGTVPEELQHSGKTVLSKIMKVIEKIAFSRIKLAVCVTKRMCRLYSERYPNSDAKFLYLPIFTSQVCRPANFTEVEELRGKLGVPITSKVYLYSGGLHTWQNIDLMLKVSKSLYSSGDHWFLFLTGETEEMKKKIEQVFGESASRVIVTHVKPEDLRNYYELADYGFIFREDHILNKVANPTKLIEYLYFGMRPIVLSSDIGDFSELGYEYVDVNTVDLLAEKNEKSVINRSISLRLLADVETVNLPEHIQC